MIMIIILQCWILDRCSTLIALEFWVFKQLEWVKLQILGGGESGERVEFQWSALANSDHISIQTFNFSKGSLLSGKNSDSAKKSPGSRGLTSSQVRNPFLSFFSLIPWAGIISFIKLIWNSSLNLKFDCNGFPSVIWYYWLLLSLRGLRDSLERTPVDHHT